MEIESDEDKTKRIRSINDNMTSYCDNDIWCELKDTIILVERTFEDGNKRHGLMLAVDLEKYDYNKGSQSLIRATEGTIVTACPHELKYVRMLALNYPISCC